MKWSFSSFPHSDKLRRGESEKKSFESKFLYRTLANAFQFNNVFVVDSRDNPITDMFVLKTKKDLNYLTGRYLNSKPEFVI